MSLDGSKPYVLSFWLFISIQLPLIGQPAFFLNGSAMSLSEQCYSLTSEQSSQDVGSIWSEIPLDLNHSFEIRFAVNLGCRDRIGEGIAFVMHNDPKNLNALGCPGNGLGYAVGNRSNCKALSPSIALEIDSRYSAGQADAYYPHLCLIRNGNLQKPLAGPVRPYANGKNPVDCEYHQMRITWKPSKQEIQVFVDEQLRLSHQIELSDRVFQGQSEVFFGFTGASSERAALQMVCVQSVMMELDESFEAKRRFEENVGIFTDPLREKLTVDIRLQQEQYLELQLFDQSGKLIYEVPPHLVRQNQYYVNLPGLPSGVYFITVTNGNERVSRKIIHVANMRA